MEAEPNETRSICVNLLPAVPKKEHKEAIKPSLKTKRQIVQEKQWAFSPERLANQGEILTNSDAPEHRFLMQQIHQKVYGYKYQDVEKGLYCEDAFVTKTQVVDLLRESALKCYYCRESVLLLYEYVREPKQWTLERIDNSLGHQFGNVVVACLGCNLRRRTMYHERFAFTKQLSVVKRAF
jgi:hypothetical protein